MQPQYGFRNHRLNEIKSAPALVKVTIDQDSVEIIVNELERQEQRIEKLESEIASLRATVLPLNDYSKEVV